MRTKRKMSGISDINLSSANLINLINDQTNQQQKTINKIVAKNKNGFNFRSYLILKVFNGNFFFNTTICFALGSYFFGAWVHDANNIHFCII